jgi:excisionase family DNA binding protein
MATAAADRLWDVKDVARFIGMSPSYVYKAAESGEIPCVRFGSKVKFNPDVIRRLGSVNTDKEA